MSTLLEQASLVMIPSGYAEDIVYSVIPQSGAGDLSFTRASNGTRVNSAGLVEVTPWNLASYSEDFTNGWPVTATITANTTTNPINGATNADTITGTGYVGRNIASVGVNTFFVYAKANSASVIRLNVYDGTTDRGADYNLTTGAISGVYGSPISTNAESVGNGWWKISITTNNASYSNVQIHRDSTGTCYIWGAQLNIGSTAKPYFPTTDRLNVPRLTYQNGGGGCPSLLLEKQSTNLLSYSEQFDNAAWLITGGITVTANATTSPDGTQNADLFSHGSSSNYTYQNLGVLSGTITTSIFVKKGSQSSIAFGFVAGGFTGGMSVKFNLDTQTFSGLTNYANFTSITATYESYGNGWYRLNLTGTTATSTVYYCVVGSLVDSFAVNAYLWGAQCEASSYPTSYIPTTSSSATRVADVCNKYSISSLIGQTEGTLYGQVAFPNLGAGGGSSYIYFTDGSFTNSVIIGREPASPNSKFFFYINAGGTNILSNTAINLQSGFAKMAIGYKSGNWAAYLNGNLVTSGTTTFSFSATMSRFGIGTNDGGMTIMLDSMIASETILFPTRLTNAELASLTTI